MMFVPTEGPLGLYLEEVEGGLTCVDSDPLLGPHIKAVSDQYTVRLMLTQAEAAEVKRWADVVTS